DIPVIRHRQIQTAVVGTAHPGRQKTTHTLIRDRKGEPWRVDQRYALEHHLSIAGSALTGIEIQLDILGSQVPVAIALIGRTGGEADLTQPRRSILGRLNGA